jgi:hypothetical protein
VLTYVVQYEDAPQQAFFYDVRQLWPGGDMLLVERSLSDEAALEAARALGISTTG